MIECKKGSSAVNKSAAGSCHFSYSHSGISASGIGWLGGLTLPWRGPSFLITERINFAVLPHITTASPKCSVRYTMVTDTGRCFYFPLFDKKHAFSLFCSNIQGLGLLHVRCWECILSWKKNASFESHFRRSILFNGHLSSFSVCHTFQFQQILAKCEMQKSSFYGVRFLTRVIQRR